MFRLKREDETETNYMKEKHKFLNSDPPLIMKVIESFLPNILREKDILQAEGMP